MLFWEIRKTSGQKKERRQKPPLSCRSIGTPHVVDCRSSKAFPTLSGSSGSLLPGSGRGTSTPALFIDVFRPSDSTGLRPYPRQFPEFALIPLLGSSGLRLPNTGSSAAEAVSDPDLSEPKLFLIFRPSISVSCFQSFGLVRLAPPGVYLKGSRLPFESPFNDTTGFSRARSG